MDEIDFATRIHHLNPVEVVLDNVEYFRDVLGRSAWEMGMLDDWSDRLSATDLIKAYNDQEARIAAGETSEPRLLIELPATPASGGPIEPGIADGSAHGGNHSLYSDQYGSLVDQITYDLKTAGIINASGFGNSPEEALARQLVIEESVGTGLATGELPLTSD